MELKKKFVDFNKNFLFKNFFILTKIFFHFWRPPKIFFVFILSSGFFF